MNNQCDGCQRGIPVVNGVHKDEQGFGMGCSRARYTEDEAYTQEMLMKDATASMSDELNLMQEALFGMGKCVMINCSDGFRFVPYEEWHKESEDE